MSVRHVLIGLNILAVLAIVAFLIWAVLSPKRASEETTPANLTPFFADDDLESRRLERVQGWALLFAAIVAVALPLYWLHEPSRQKESDNYFTDERRSSAAQILFSNSSMPTYNPTQSLQCANCHGANGQGGQVPTQLERQGRGLAGAAAQHGAAAVPGRSGVLAARRPTTRRHGVQRHHIITYGRPGTPMQAWGVAGGGPKNAQSIQDLVAFLRTIQLKPDDDQGAADEEPRGRAVDQRQHRRARST